MNPTPDPEDLLVIEQLLADAEPEDAEDLRPLLEDLRSFAHAGPVEPSPAVAALLLPEPASAEGASAAGAGAPTEALTAVHAVAGGDEAKTISLDAVRASRAASQGARRSAGQPARHGRRRSLAIALALTGAIGAGTAAAAAADEGFRSSLNEGVTTVLGVLTGHIPAPAQRTPDAPAAPEQQPATPSNVGQPAEPSHAATPPAASQQAPAPAAPAPTSSQKALPVPSLGAPSLPVPLPPIPTSLPQPLNPLAPLP